LRLLMASMTYRERAGHDFRRAEAAFNSPRLLRPRDSENLNRV
jgi:hypothetical protein